MSGLSFSINPTLCYILLIHLCVPSFPSALSINAAIFASVVLGSRLSSNADVFGLVLFAVEWFALFPLMRRDMVVRLLDDRLIYCMPT